MMKATAARAFAELKDGDTVRVDLGTETQIFKVAPGEKPAALRERVREGVQRWTVSQRTRPSADIVDITADL